MFPQPFSAGVGGAVFNPKRKIVYLWEFLPNMGEIELTSRQAGFWQQNYQNALESYNKHQHGRKHMPDMAKRIESMHRQDIGVAWAFVVGLWLAIIFVASATWSLAPNGAARTMLLIGGAMILLLNTAAILAMLRHYREDRDFMYGLDIKFLDIARAQKRQ
ncbi:hypothetical protein [Primorskyibacter flagellatus]